MRQGKWLTRLPRTQQVQRRQVLTPQRLPDGAKAAQDAGPGWSVFMGESTKRDWMNANAIWNTLTAAQLEVIYRNSALVFACVREITTTLAEAPLEVGMEGPDGEWTVTPHPLDAIFDMPNPDYDYTEFLSRFSSRLLLTGRGYIWKWRQASGMIGELWPLPTSMVKPLTGTSEEGGQVISRLVKGYEVNQGLQATPKEVEAIDMLDARFPDPATTNEGVGPAQASARDYQLDRGREDYLIEMLTNLKVPGTIIRSSQPLGTPEKDAIIAEVHNRAGHGARGGVVFISGPDAEMKMPTPLADMDWHGFANLSESRICAAFNVPPIIVGVRVGLDRSTYSNYAEARKSFYSETMVPLWRAVAGVFTRSLLRHEGDDSHEIRFNTNNISGLHEDATEVATRAVALFSGGIITLDEARSDIGRPAFKIGGDVRRVPIGMLEQPAGKEPDVRDAQ